MAEQFTASMDQLPGMLEYILAHARSQGFDKERLGQIELAAEEALVNIIEHAYPSHENGVIQISCAASAPTSVQIVIKDQGNPFDPLVKGKGFDPEAAVRAGAEGGFGIFLMTKMMDEVRYKRIDGCNVLTLTKNGPS